MDIAYDTYEREVPSVANKLKPLSAEEQHALREKAKSELERLEVVYADNHTKEKIHTLRKSMASVRLYIKLFWTITSLTKRESIQTE